MALRLADLPRIMLTISAEAAKPTATTTWIRMGRYSCICAFNPKLAALPLGDGRRSGHRRRRGLQGGQLLGDALVLLEFLFHHSARNQILKLFIRTQAKHLFATAGRIAGPQIGVND